LAEPLLEKIAKALRVPLSRLMRVE